MSSEISGLTLLALATMLFGTSSFTFCGPSGPRVVAPSGGPILCVRDLVCSCQRLDKDTIWFSNEITLTLFPPLRGIFQKSDPLTRPSEPFHNPLGMEEIKADDTDMKRREEEILLWTIDHSGNNCVDPIDFEEGWRMIKEYGFDVLQQMIQSLLNIPKNINTSNEVERISKPFGMKAFSSLYTISYNLSNREADLSDFSAADCLYGRYCFESKITKCSLIILLAYSQNSLLSRQLSKDRHTF